jgi:hypothetical protein
MSLTRPIRRWFFPAEVKNHELEDVSLINISFDIHAGNAAEILSASRDSLTPTGNTHVQEKLSRTLLEIFPIYLSVLKETARNNALQRIFPFLFLVKLMDECS